MAGPVLVVSSQVVRGSVGGRGTVFALERLGHAVWFLPTILLPWHPGQGPAPRLPVEDADFARLAGDLAGSRFASELAGILTGYFATPAQVAAAAEMITRLKARRPDLVYLCDPVMGDVGAAGGRLYIPEATAAAIRDRLLPLADIATPNLFEAGWLAGGATPADSAGAVAAARALGVPAVVVTSAPPLMSRSVGTLLVSGQTAWQAEHPALSGPPNGTGDLMSALLLSARLAGLSLEQALTRATASVFDMAARAARAHADELPLAAEQDVLAHSMAHVSLRRLAVP